ncbi:Gypsy retrotransposon integrase-like protein 1 [Stygiomarasmius scandens]|uniref:Gypsy retrotransposon integrase-like protein 1 n=1 Tax=Marasmiellus scandens TaxID=2682957 RepID=A0ABR1JJ34_9AGAR
MEDQPFVPPASPSPEPEIEPSNYSGLEIGAGYGNEAEPENDDEDDESSIHNSRTKFHGHSSTADLIKSAISMKKEYTGEGFEGKRGRPRFHRPVYWEVLPRQWQKLYHRDPPPLEFPPNDLLLSLVDLYFQNVNFITPFLHRPTFDRLIASNAHMHQYDFGALLLAVCAMGSRYSDDPRVFADDSNSELSIGWRYMGQVRSLPLTLTIPGDELTKGTSRFK